MPRVQHRNSRRGSTCVGVCVSRRISLDGGERSGECANVSFVRGLLEMPLLLDGLSQGMRELAPFVLTWGVWVAVSQVDFDLIVAGWSRPEVLVVPATLANNLPTYSKSVGTSATLTTRGGLRPLVNITSSTDATLIEHHTKGIPKEELAATLNTVFAERSR
jgi:hypothetical protein